MSKFEMLRGLVPSNELVVPVMTQRATGAETDIVARNTSLKACSLPPNHSSRDMGVRLNVSPTNRPRRGNAR